MNSHISGGNWGKVAILLPIESDIFMAMGIDLQDKLFWIKTIIYKTTIINEIYKVTIWVQSSQIKSTDGNGNWPTRQAFLN